MLDYYNVVNNPAKLIADCASMKTNDPTNEKVRTAAISKAKELGMLGDAGNLLHFTCVKFKTFYECVGLMLRAVF
ncbi:hypothetical protein Pmar_PMAR005843 [Perkinsus marinus ATCC 50983]|uniref:Uncharacterized protein n=1 Tax=Perkinsus marinus (strain ATCC 50983 / TXsc) TaxID=423536 RepID=C5KYD1_PERM5|nr:hypothetical protein Pmar_PMAR005843 [Perkinsus marinus ATCC 50983]EER10508.1 hypothetical protein Pmar_PMAR005843 [Perkinsus marinus ATCC 50983]|eukprot:XP_002778713.1 hypothetical protein Pmar_PMAR005843 [Perkinsus marinus ATCC 50983]